MTNDISNMWTPIKAQSALDRIKKIPLNKKWFNSRELSDLLDQSKGWVWMCIKNGRLQSKKDVTRGVTNNYLIVAREDVIDFLQKYLVNF